MCTRHKCPGLQHQCFYCIFFMLRRIVAQGMLNVPHAFGLALFDDSIYWTDWTRLGVLKISKFGEDRSSVVWTPEGAAIFPMSIAAYHKFTQLTGDKSVLLSTVTIPVSYSMILTLQRLKVNALGGR